jgi:hypothetical protein
MLEENMVQASEEPQDENPFDLDLHIYALDAQDQVMLASGPNVSTGAGCAGGCHASMIVLAE